MIEFISVIIPYFCRPHYMDALIASIEEHADMAYELIIHDDGSTDGSSDEIYNKYKDRVSTLIFNRGRNLGLAVASNRLVSIAESEYILFLNADCAIIQPCFRDICNVLSKDYVGYIHPQDTMPKPVEYATVKGTNFAILGGIGGGCIMAFRKSVWREAGKFMGFTGCADAGFLMKLLQLGYFRGYLVGGPRARNVSLDEHSSADSSAGLTNGFDTCCPRLFHIEQEAVDDESRERLLYWGGVVKEQEMLKDGWANMDYWAHHEERIFPEGTKVSAIDWEVAKEHGKAKWKETIQAENWVQT